MKKLLKNLSKPVNALQAIIQSNLEKIPWIARKKEQERLEEEERKMADRILNAYTDAYIVGSTYGFVYTSFADSLLESYYRS